MFKYRSKRLKEENKDKSQSNEEKTKSDNNQTKSTETSNKDSSFSNKRYKYRRFNKNIKTEEEIKPENNNNNQNNIESLNEKTNNINEDESNINKPTKIIINSKKDDILKKLKDIVPIIEDKEGEENITPNKQKSNDDDKIINNMPKNEFKIENDENKSPNEQIIKKKTEKNKKYYDNELIDAILDVEKYNVNNYLSRDLAEIYADINKENIFFKNDIFLRNIDNFERKTGNLDKKKFYSSYFIDDINYKMKQVPKTDEIINKFVEKSKFFN